MNETLIKILLIVTVIIFFYFFSYLSMRRRKRKQIEYEKEFLEKLKKHNDVELFVYTSRKKSKQLIEDSIIPNLDKNINVIFLNGRSVHSESLDNKFVSIVLYRIKNKGFPNIIRISEGRILDTSLKDSFYKMLNQGKSPQFFMKSLEDALGDLRKK